MALLHCSKFRTLPTVYGILFEPYPFFPLCFHRSQIQKAGEAVMVTEEFMGPSHPLEPNSALPSPLPARGCMSCGEDVN